MLPPYKRHANIIPLYAFIRQWHGLFAVHESIRVFSIPLFKQTNKGFFVPSKLEEMQMKKLNEIAYEVADIQAPMKVIVNYLDCIKLQITKDENSGDTALAFYSLVNNRGLDNVMDTLELLSDRAEDLANRILEYSDEEEAINEQA